MLALKKKREAEAKAAAEEAVRAKEEPASGGDGSAGQPAKVSLLGIGGKKQANAKKSTGKKRSPGEIRIQKGNFLIHNFSIFLFVKSIKIYSVAQLFFVCPNMYLYNCRCAHYLIQFWLHLYRFNNNNRYC